MEAPSEDQTPSEDVVGEIVIVSAEEVAWPDKWWIGC